MAELNITDQNFEEEVLKSDVPVLVDFWAPWCGPCRMQGPIIDELAEEMKGSPVKIGKVNVDESQETAQKFGIRSIPTLIIFVGGEPKEQMTGVQQKKDLKKKLETVV